MFSPPFIVAKNLSAERPILGFGYEPGALTGFIII
jgi:hypothetical protein